MEIKTQEDLWKLTHAVDHKLKKLTHHREAVESPYSIAYKHHFPDGLPDGLCEEQSEADMLIGEIDLMTERVSSRINGGTRYLTEMPKVIDGIKTTDRFNKRWKELDLSLDFQREIRSRVWENPEIGTVISGFGDYRKFRVEFPDDPTGKSGGIRIIYTYIHEHNRIYLVFCYSKSSQDDLTKNQKKSILRDINSIREKSKESI